MKWALRDDSIINNISLNYYYFIRVLSLWPKLAVLKLFRRYTTHKEHLTKHRICNAALDDSTVLVFTDAVYLIRSECERCFICVWTWQPKNAWCLLWAGWIDAVSLGVTDRTALICYLNSADIPNNNVSMMSVLGSLIPQLQYLQYTRCCGP